MSDGITLFEFRQSVSIPKATGKRARNVRELREMIMTASHECIFHHMYQYFLKDHILEYTNDFAEWAGESLEERSLAESLSNIDPYDFTDIQALRNTIVGSIDAFLNTLPEPRETIAGEEFYFNETITLIFPIGVRAANLAEFLTAMRYVGMETIYYHFYEARMRLGGGIDDFSRWIEDVFGKMDLAVRIRGIDPFMHSLEEIRQHIVEEVEEEVRRDMETIDQCLTGI